MAICADTHSHGDQGMRRRGRGSALILPATAYLLLWSISAVAGDDRAEIFNQVNGLRAKLKIHQLQESTAGNCVADLRVKALKTAKVCNSNVKRKFKSAQTLSDFYQCKIPFDDALDMVMILEACGRGHIQSAKDFVETLAEDEEYYRVLINRSFTTAGAAHDGDYWALVLGDKRALTVSAASARDYPLAIYFGSQWLLLVQVLLVSGVLWWISF